MQRLLSAAKDGGDEWDKRGSQWEYFMDMLWGKSMFNMNKNIGTWWLVVEWEYFMEYFPIKSWDYGLNNGRSNE